jgi:hypothetical protein
MKGSPRQASRVSSKGAAPKDTYPGQTTAGGALVLSAAPALYPWGHPE